MLAAPSEPISVRSRAGADGTIAAVRRSGARTGVPTMAAPPSRDNGCTRRALLGAALPFVALGPLAARAADAPVPIADMHSHLGMIRRRSMKGPEFARSLREERVALIAWALPADARWIRATDTGLAQAADPAPGQLAAFFRDNFALMRAAVAEGGLRTVLRRADVDACIAGESGVVLASEGADFLEGRIDDLAAYHELGLRHLQLVHYIKTPVGDFQTMPPRHDGLSDFGSQLIEASNERGLLVDLAHCSAGAVDRALDIARAPLVWSHSWVDRTGGRWQDGYGYLQRRLSLAQARKIAAAGGVVGLWGLGLSQVGPSRTPGQGNWTVGRGDIRAYARELANLVNWLGADHVAIGTDIEGVGANWSVDHYGHVRRVVESLQGMQLPDGVVEKVAYANYARVLKVALRS